MDIEGKGEAVKIEVKEFVDNYQDSLPAIAVHKILRKIDTGKKNG